MATPTRDVAGEATSADGQAERSEGASAASPLVVDLRRLQSIAGNRAAIAYLARSRHGARAGARRLQRQTTVTRELASDAEAVQYASAFAAQAGRRSLTNETRRLFRYLVKTYASSAWDDLGSKWTFDDYPFQTFTFAAMPDPAGTGVRLGIGPAFVTRIATGDLKGVLQELRETLKRVRTPELSGRQVAVPGLGAETTAAVAAKITARDPQGALDLLVQSKVKVGVIDPSLLVGGKMVYDPDLKSADGQCSMQAWDHLKNSAEPTLARIGPGAFSSVAYLYSVVMHEYEHVRQRQSLPNQQNESKLREAGTKSGNEVEAYAWELTHAGESGIKSLPNKVATIWSSLNEEFWILDTAEQAKVRGLALKARARAEAMVKGSPETLVPFQAP
jgi:hypothetical protein